MTLAGFSSLSLRPLDKSWFCAQGPFRILEMAHLVIFKGWFHNDPPHLQHRYFNSYTLADSAAPRDSGAPAPAVALALPLHHGSEGRTRVRPRLPSGKFDLYNYVRIWYEATFIFIVSKALLSETFDETFTYETRLGHRILLNLNLASLAKLSRLRYSWLRFGLASASYCGLEVYDRPVYVNSRLTHS